MRPDYPWGSKLPHLQVHVGASNSVYMQRGPVAIDFFSSLIFMLSVTEIQLCKVNAHFLLDERHYCMQPVPFSQSTDNFFVPPTKTKLAVRNNITSPRQRVYTGELKEERFSLRKTIVPN